MTEQDVSIRFTLADDDGPFAIPEIGILMSAGVALEGGRWRATSHYDEQDRQWTATGETRSEAIVRLLAARIGVTL